MASSEDLILTPHVINKLGIYRIDYSNNFARSFNINLESSRLWHIFCKYDTRQAVLTWLHLTFGKCATIIPDLKTYSLETYKCRLSTSRETLWLCDKHCLLIQEQLTLMGKKKWP